MSKNRLKFLQMLNPFWSTGISNANQQSGCWKCDLCVSSSNADSFKTHQTMQVSVDDAKFTNNRLLFKKAVSTVREPLL